jgi:Flp pilus assembly pilin Flp
MYGMPRRLLCREDGQTMAEYGAVLAVIAVVTMVVYMALGDGIATLLQKVTSTI